MYTLTQLRQHRCDITALLHQHHLSNPRVFGSVLSGEQNPDSDVDLLVDMTESTTLFDMGAVRQGLYELLAVDVDVVTEADLPVSFRAEVLRMAQPL